jgi:hypothetical protein
MEELKEVLERYEESVLKKDKLIASLTETLTKEVCLSLHPLPFD